LFRKVSTTRSFEDVARQIQEAIVEGRIRTGDKLPSQRELMEIFQVSRATILEALRVLEKAGLIVIRLGSQGGAFVSEVSSDKVTEALSLFFHMGNVTVEELAEFRERLEGGTAFWAARRATGEELSEMEALVQRIRTLAEAGVQNIDRITEEDLHFHILIAKASKNTPSLAVMHAIHSNIEEALNHIPPNHASRWVADLEGILKALVSRQAEEAERLMLEHIRHFNQVVLEQVAARPLPVIEEEPRRNVFGDFGSSSSYSGSARP
jgi:GntR family transcriptional regulator, transcriptional repressor for pyruvate dehydrogenase complex